MTPVIELTELLKKLQITSFHSVAPIPFGEKHLSFGGFHSVELQISIEQGNSATVARARGGVNFALVLGCPSTPEVAEDSSKTSASGWMPNPLRPQRGSELKGS